MEDILEKYKSSILHLRILKKTDFGVVLEPLMGHECFLHISHISRDIERGKALHSLLNVGDYIDAVLMRINPRYNSFDVSTKVFEEHNLTIHPAKCRQIIEERLKRRTSKDDHDLTEYRSILNRLLSDLNREGETFAFELLQNADDYPNKIYENKVRITFELKDEYLLVKHDGSPFTESNVNSICSILLSDQERLGDENRIGYKGIGFKSVFHYSSWVYIHSGNFSFRFDKNAEIFNSFKNKNILPWEVMPVITDEKEVIKKINDYEFFNKPVGFALKIRQKDQEAIKETLERVIENPTVILFLRHIREVRLKYNKKQKILSVDEKVNVFENPKKILYQQINSATEKFQYGIFNDSFTIEDEEVIEELRRDEIPEKYKSFRNPKIIFAFSQYQGSVLKKTTNKDLFCYLPLKDTNYGFPFYINSDFIPDLDRTKPISNLKYNQSIMFKAGIFFVDLLEAFTKQKNDWHYAPTLIPENQGSDEILVQEFWRGMDSVIADRSILKNRIGNQCRLNEILFDKEGFAERVLANDFDKFFLGYQILNSEYIETKNIESLIKRHEAGIILNKSKIKL